MPREAVSAVAAIDAVPHILKVVCQTTGMGFAAVARVTQEQWIALAVRDEIGFGLEPGGELALATTICDQIRDSREPVVIDHVDQDPCWADHPTPKMYGFQSYISVPITFRDGRFFGTLCAIDPAPRELRTGAALKTFELYAELIALHLQNREKVVSTTVALMDERRTAEMREQFMAVLGHDLRNPLAALASGLNLLAREPLSARGLEVTRLMRESAKRMTELTADILDMARGQLGGGVPLRASWDEGLAAVLSHVVDELRTVHPERTIDATIEVTEPVFCDAPRLAQLLSNLVGNALTHGAPDRPVTVAVDEDGGMLTMTVVNYGSTIAPETLDQIFRPFSRGQAAKADGLGLGLYICAEIAKAHGGSLTASSQDGVTAFRAELPCAQLGADKAA